jgi:teichoic acid transport system permease protein
VTPAAPRSAVRENEFTTERHVHEPHRAGLPPIWGYVREVWRRREFALELARTTLRAQHFNTALGQFWLVLNPVLLTGIYFVLVDILQAGARGPKFLAHLMIGLFTFQFLTTSVTHGARSVVRGGRLILNTAFPRTLLPLSSVITAFMRFLPTVLVYAAVHVAAGLPLGRHLLWVVPIFALIVVFCAGITMLVAAAQVYFRDVSSFLPYGMRVWLYASPVLYYLDEVPARFEPIITANPMSPLLTSLSDVLNRGDNPSLVFMASGAAWAFGAFVVGSIFFMSREREFAIRL